STVSRPINWSSFPADSAKPVPLAVVSLDKKFLERSPPLSEDASRSQPRNFHLEKTPNTRSLEPILIPKPAAVIKKITPSRANADVSTLSYVTV
ncbi:hypothetical protein ACO0R3_002809, partial [Hanseniaspora guilliermondii]